MKTTLCLLALTVSSLTFAGIEQDCYRSFKKGQALISRGVSYTKAAEAARKELVEAKENDSVEDFCKAAAESEKQAHQAVEAFIGAREELGNAYSICSAPNDDRAHEASVSAGKQVEKLLTFTSDLAEITKDLCEDE
jgi:hypothetical protein